MLIWTFCETNFSDFVLISYATVFYFLFNVCAFVNDRLQNAVNQGLDARKPDMALLASTSGSKYKSKPTINIASTCTHSKCFQSVGLMH